MTNYRYTYSAAGAAFRPGVIVRMEDPSQVAINLGNNGGTYAGYSATLYQVTLH